MYFRCEYVKQLLEEDEVTPSEKSKSGAPRNPAELPRRLKARHFPSKVKPKVGAKKSNPTRRCVVCFPAEQQIRKSKGLPAVSRPGKESTYECSECNVGLCAAPCFGLYHTYKDYILAYKRLAITGENEQ